MRQKFTEKHSKKKSVAIGKYIKAAPTIVAISEAPEFSAVKNVAGAKAPDQSWWTGAQFAALVPGFDEPKLRRLGIENNPATNAPWIPKPRGAKFEFTPTLKGVLAHLLHKASTGDGAPAYFDSMEHLESCAPFTPKKFTAWALKNGAGEARLGGSRINPRPVWDLLNRLGVSVATGAMTGIDGLEEFDKNTEQAKLARVQKEDQEIDLELKRRRIHDLNEVERRCRGEILSPLRDGLHGLQKKAARLGPTQPAIFREIVETDLPALLKKINE